VRTEYEGHNADFSNAAHMAARRLIYPHVFGVDDDALQFEDTLLDGGTERERILDGEMGVDRIVRVSTDGLHAPIVYTVQERFRRPEYSGYGDMTITEWNGASNLPSELYKINAGLFVYGYFSEERATFIDWVCVDVVRLLLNITHGSINYTSRQNRKQQTFFCFPMAELRVRKCILAKKRHGVMGR